MAETGPFFAKMSLKRYLVLVPWEVLLPLGQPEGLVFSPSGTFFGGRYSVGSSVLTLGPTLQYTGILPWPLGHMPLFSLQSAQVPKTRFLHERIRPHERE